MMLFSRDKSEPPQRFMDTPIQGTISRETNSSMHLRILSIERPVLSSNKIRVYVVNKNNTWAVQEGVKGYHGCGEPLGVQGEGI